MNVYNQENTTLNNNSVAILNSVEAQSNTDNTAEQSVKQKILSFAQAQQLQSGDRIPVEEYLDFLSSLSSDETTAEVHAWTTLVEEGYFDEVNGVHVLTELGQIALSGESAKVTEVVTQRILKFVRDHQLTAGSPISVKPYTDFCLGLSPVERNALPDAWATLLNAGWFEPQNGDYYLTPLGQSSIDEQYTTVKQGVKHKILQFAKACQLTEQNRLNYQQYRTEFLKGLSVAETVLVRDAWAELVDEKYFHPVDSSHYLTQFGYQAIHTMQ